MELPNTGISFSVTGLPCSCKNVKCTLPEHYSGLIDAVFIKNVYFVNAEADLSKALSLAVKSQISGTLFKCKTNMSDNIIVKYNYQDHFQSQQTVRLVPIFMTK